MQQNYAEVVVFRQNPDKQSDSVAMLAQGWRKTSALETSSGSLWISSLENAV